jgi:hypothetical protein
VLSGIAAGLAAVASTVSLSWDGAYPAPSPAPVVNLVLAEARGYCAATLVVAIPLALLSLRAALRGSMRGRLLWIGSQAYFVYTYLEFAVSPPFTPLYLVYVGAFACALPALILGVASVDVGEVGRTFGDRAPRRALGVFSLVLAALLALAWLKDIAAQTLAGSFGWLEGADAVGHVVHALDLGLQVPLALAAGVLLLRRRPAGDLVGAIVLANAVCMGGALTAMVAWPAAVSGRSVGTAWPFAIAWGTAIAFAVAFFRRGDGTVAVERVGGGVGKEPRP